MATKILKDCKGLTLLEILLAMVIAGLLAAIAGPDLLGTTRRARLQSAANDVFTNMQRAKLNAINQSASWAIHFDTGSEQYRILSADGGDGDWTNGNETVAATIPLSDYSGISFGTSQGSRPEEQDPTAAGADGVSFANNVTVFTPSGVIESTSLGSVYLSNEDGDTFAVGINTLAGLAKTWHNYSGGWVDR